MSSASKELKVITLCAYLTDVSEPWRPADHTAAKMVKALKGDPINGYFEVKINNVRKRFDQSNVAEFVPVIPKVMCKSILANITGAATLVPIPNSHVVTADDQNFKTLHLAREIAGHSGSRLVAVPALIFREPQVKSRAGGPRSPYYFKGAYKVCGDVKGQIVLIDDVRTSGAHMIGACWKLNSQHRQVVLGCAFGGSTKERFEQPLEVREETLSLITEFDSLF